MARGNPRLLRWAAGLSVFAGVLHSLLTSSHFEQWWGYGVFFMLAAMAQGLYGFFVFASHLLHEAPITQRWNARQLRAYYAVGIAGNLLLVGMYVVTRTVGIPFFGPEAGTVEEWDVLGLVTKGLELVIVALLVVLAMQAKDEPTAPRAVAT